jgi:hypothetical protein
MKYAPVPSITRQSNKVPLTLVAGTLSGINRNT